MEFILKFYADHPIIIIYLILINIGTAVMYVIDKIKARNNSWRIRERTLLLLALAGGSVGAVFAMKFFRHKTKKESFLLWFVLIIALQVIILLYVPTAVDYLLNLDIVG
jgi:uncharacterized membrane protein YsdA (DUF1294 family)